MFGSLKPGANAYAQVGVETGVMSASPHKLIVMLYDGVLASLASAVRERNAGNIAAKCAAMSKAVTIIDEGLRTSLNKDKGGDIAVKLDLLYEYIVRRLLEANGTNRFEAVEEAQKLLTDLRGAWLAIDPQKASSAPVAASAVAFAARPAAYPSASRGAAIAA